MKLFCFSIILFSTIFLQSCLKDIKCEEGETRCVQVKVIDQYNQKAPDIQVELDYHFPFNGTTDAQDITDSDGKLELCTEYRCPKFLSGYSLRFDEYSLKKQFYRSFDYEKGISWGSKTTINKNLQVYKIGQLIFRIPSSFNSPNNQLRFICKGKEVDHDYIAPVTNYADSMSFSLLSNENYQWKMELLDANDAIIKSESGSANLKWKEIKEVNL
jgi:hypothetical protein